MTTKEQQLQTLYAEAISTGVDPVTGRKGTDPTTCGGSPSPLGCANPFAVLDLSAGDVVLDLGSGTGLDVLTTARRVGRDGYVYGLDMTEEMIAVSRANQAEAGIPNAQFLKGYVDDIPLSDSSVDAVISNCVFNLVEDKPAAFAEMFRVLKPGGQIGVADLLAAGVPVQTNVTIQPLTRSGYVERLQEAGFTDVRITETDTQRGDGLVAAVVAALKLLCLERPAGLS